MAFSMSSLQYLRITLPKWNQSLSLCSSRKLNLPSKSNKIYEELGLPQPPKRPLTPYLQFTVDTKDAILPGGRYSKERVSVLGKKWKSLPNAEKDKYLKQYEAAKEKYTRDLQEYNDKLGSERLQQIKILKHQRKTLEKLERESKKERALKKKTTESLGKPKPPVNGFLLFVGENAEKFNRGEPGFFIRVGKAWQELEETKRDDYKRRFRVQMEAYQLELIKWEQKMVDLGHLDLVRKSNLNQLVDPKNNQEANVTKAKE